VKTGTKTQAVAAGIVDGDAAVDERCGKYQLIE